MVPITVQRFMRRTEALRLRPLDRHPHPTLDHRVSEHMPALAPRPSTPCTPAEIVRGTPRWPGVLVLRPVTVFGPPNTNTINLNTVNTTMVDTVGTPGSEISQMVRTPEDEVAPEVSNGKGPTKIAPASLSDKLRELSSN